MVLSVLFIVNTTINISGLRVVKWVVLCGSLVLAWLLRTVSVLAFEPAIFAFDATFNARCARYIDENGVVAFMEWFDEKAWYPFGRMTGETSYPGMMVMAVLVKRVLNALRVRVEIVDICIFWGPVWSIVCCVFCYKLGKLFNENVGLMCAWGSAMCSALVIGTFSGNFDYESSGIALIVISVYYFILAVESGSFLHIFASVFAYGVMCASWGGYVFLGMLIPAYVVCLCFAGYFTYRLYIVSCIWIVFGFVFAANVPLVAANMGLKPQELLEIGTFGLLQVVGICNTKVFSKRSLNTLLILAVVIGCAISVQVLYWYDCVWFTGRLRDIVNPFVLDESSWASVVSEQAPMTWAALYSGMGLIIYLFPLGYSQIMGFSSRVKIFFMIYGAVGLYTSTTMVRCLQVAAPGFLVICAIGLDFLIVGITTRRLSCESFIGLIVVFAVAIITSNHNVYKALNFAISGMTCDIEDANGITEANDEIEVYRWIHDNTKRDAKVLSLWVNGYHIAWFADRTSYSDGQTGNFTHMSLTSSIVLSPEIDAWKLARMLDVDFYMVRFGGCSGVSDDISLSGALVTCVSSIFHNISIEQFGSPFLLLEDTTPETRESLLFKASYNHFENFTLNEYRPPLRDMARPVDIEGLTSNMTKFTESYTTQHWMFRLYRVHSDPIWDEVV